MRRREISSGRAGKNRSVANRAGRRAVGWAGALLWLAACVSLMGQGPAGASTGNAAGVQVTSVNLPSDRVRVSLSGPAPRISPLTVTWNGPGGNDDIASVVEGPGSYIFNPNLGGLVMGQYSGVTATWDGASGTYTSKFYVLGAYLQGQYNTPTESRCAGGPSPAHLTRGPSACAWSLHNLISDFITQAWENGRGRTTSHGPLQIENICRHPTRASKNYFREVSSIIPACGSHYSLSGTTVAINRMDQSLKCGDRVLILGLGSGVGTVKEVTDYDSGLSSTQLDNYNTGAACSPDAFANTGNHQSIRLSHGLWPEQASARVLGESARWSVSLSATKPCPVCPDGVSFVFDVKNRVTGARTHFTMANDTERVSDIRVPPNANLAAVLGQIGESGVVTIVALPSGKVRDTFWCVWPKFSPDSRFIAFRKFFPAHPGYGVWFSDEYLVYDLSQSPKFNRMSPVRGAAAGVAVYPPGATNRDRVNFVSGPKAFARSHNMASSGFFWPGPDSVAFVDRYRGVNSLVVADMRRGLKSRRVTVWPLDAAKLVNWAECRRTAAPSDFERWSKHPGDLIYADGISGCSKKLDCVQVRLEPVPGCLATTVVDVQVGPW